MASEMNVRRGARVLGAEVCALLIATKTHEAVEFHAPCPSWLIIVNKPRVGGGSIIGVDRYFVAVGV